MSKKKSLGSSPIDVKPKQNTSMSFIPDLGVNKDRPEKEVRQNNGRSSTNKKRSVKKETPKKSKKVVSYNLEVDLVEKVKTVASENDMYYSSLVSKVLKKWLMNNS